MMTLLADEFFTSRRTLALATLFALAGAFAPAGATAVPQNPTASRPRPDPSTVNAQAAALQDFQRRLDAYVRLRENLERRLATVARAAEQTALAAAVQQARAAAKQGDLIPLRVQGQIRTTVAADFRRRDLSSLRAAFEEVPLGTLPGLNRRYPANAALATVPPLLLNSLPRLPDDLQYRFFDRHIVLVDGETNLIVDYVANVLPPLAQNDPEHH